MPSSVLFGINNEGRVHTLSTTGAMWRELPYVGQEFKKLSGIPHFLWALGGDHQVYVYVHGLDVPIRVQEECYENERWIPIEGFSTRLLPTDRYKFSSIDGTVNRAIQFIRLPSMAWQWEGDWQIECTLNGQPLDHDGWTYAVDFPAQYYPKKQWKSCVRRRLWVRSRRYSAMNSWCAIAPLHKDATAEPFIDISVGGQSIPGAEVGTMVVWAVTSHNRVMFRSGVTTRSPEGAKWTLISVPVGCEINQLSVGPTGLVWASLLDCRALVRVGVGRDSLSGESWVEVRGPGDNLRINQLSVGNNSVWAVSQDKQVWFRKGVKGDTSGLNEECAVGCGWVEMVGKMSSVSVALYDQVFAIGTEDRAVYFRMGISNGDLTGKRWRALHAPLQVSRASSNASLSRDRFQNRSNSSLNRPHSLCESSGLGDFEEQSHSAPTAPTSLPVGDYSGKHFETQLKNPKAWSPVRSVGSIVGTEVISDETVYLSDRQDSCVFAEDEELGWAEYEAPWSCVEAGACSVDPNQLPNWFATSNNLNQTETDQPWRVKILENLKCRLPDCEKYSEYEAAVDTQSWTHTDDARVSLDASGSFVDCILQLEWIRTVGTLTILHLDGASTMHQFSMAEVTCVQCSSEPGNPRLSLFTPHLNPAVVRLQFATDTLMEEWQVHLATVCKQIQNYSGAPPRNSIWGITTLGDVFVSNSNIDADISINNSNFEGVIDLSGKPLPIKLPLHTNLIPGSKIIVTGSVDDDADRISFNLQSRPTYKLRHKAFSELENIVLHFNPRLKDKVLVRNSMVDDKWGEEEISANTTFEAGKEFEVIIECKEEAFKLYEKDELLCIFRRRFTHTVPSIISLRGKMQIFKIILNTPYRILKPLDTYWGQIGGHLRRLEACRLGVVWGIGYDHTAWVYNGGWGGGPFGSLDSHNVNAMVDSQDYRIYENQRWNPVTGYTSTGLPTDRHMWSDITGKQKRTKEQVKLLSMRWQWVSDWMVDFHVPKGVDRDGWQYAVDFPSSYHANKQFTDYVRRRRWYRRCAVSATGPWNELGHTKLLEVSLETVSKSEDATIAVWALASGGQAMIRVGVSVANPTGTKWEHVSSDQTLCSISCGPFDKVWSVGKNGCAYSRSGIRPDLLEGEKWCCVEPPNNAQLKQISTGAAGVWAVDFNGKIHVLKEQLYPKLIQWQCIGMDPSASSGGTSSSSFKQVSVGDTEVWAVTDGGLVLRREGVYQDNPAGTGWDAGIASVQFRITRQCRRFSSSTTSQPGSKTLTSVCRDENIVHSTSSSSESELDENDVTVEYCRGLPQVTVPLPSRRERCRFTLKPITNNVGDLVHMLKNEDRGIDRVVALTQDDTRIASSSTIENLLEEDFKLLINDKVYLVRTPKQSRITGEEAKGLSDIKTLVSQLYEALNVQEHTIQVEKNLNTQLEVLRQELLPLEEKKNHLDLIAQRKSDWMAWIGLGLMSVQFGILARLTWWEYSWDIMEPVTYFVTYGTAMAGYAYFVLTKQEYVLKDVKDRQHLLTLHKNAKKKGFDLERYNIIRTQISHLERDLFKIKYPLKLHKAKKSAVQPATAETEITKQATTDAKLAH